MTRRIALIGLGEAGRVFAESLAGPETALTAWDIAFADAASPASRNLRALTAGTTAADTGTSAGPVLTAASSAAAAVAGADLVISAVTAAGTVAAARSAAPAIPAGCWYFDLNSASPAGKRRAAEVIDGAGGRYVEAALMSPVHPRGLGSPFLLGGPHAAAFHTEAILPGLIDLPAADFCSPEIGVAAATKLCRSVVVKGLEAIFTESLLAARGYGVEQEVLGSLANILPGADWERLAGYFITRSLQHGQRRSEEMAEAARTVAEAGIEPIMALATAHRQALAGEYGQVLGPAVTAGLPELLDATREVSGEVSGAAATTESTAPETGGTTHS